MTGKALEDDAALEFTFDFDDPRSKVWRAISDDALRSHWLPDQRIVATLGARPMERLDLLMEETDPPHRQSIVSFSLSDRPYGGTTLAIRHSVKLAAAAANSNSPTMLLRAA